MKTTKLAFAGALLLLGTLFVPGAWASQDDKMTIVKFNQPVEVPGRVLLPGTYVFRLADLPEHNVVEIFNANRSRLIGIFNAVPDYRLQPSSTAVITVVERAANSPEAVKEWFFPGDSYGQEFVYPAHHSAGTSQHTKS